MKKYIDNNTPPLNVILSPRPAKLPTAGQSVKAKTCTLPLANISRPGGKLLMLSAVPFGDRKQILRTVGEKETCLKAADERNGFVFTPEDIWCPEAMYKP